jgi:hypothetical protein
LQNRYIIERAIISDAFQNLDQELGYHDYRFDLELDGGIRPEPESVHLDTQTMTVMFFFTNEIIRKGVRPKKEEERVRCT